MAAVSSSIRRLSLTGSVCPRGAVRRQRRPAEEVLDVAAEELQSAASLGGIVLVHRGGDSGREARLHDVVEGGLPRARELCGEEAAVGGKQAEPLPEPPAD